MDQKEAALIKQHKLSFLYKLYKLSYVIKYPRSHPSIRSLEAGQLSFGKGREKTRSIVKKHP